MQIYNRIEKITNSINHVIFRFPLAILCAAIGTAIMIYITYKLDNETENYLIKTIMSLSLGIPAFTAIKLFSEARSWTATKLNLSRLAILVLMTVYAFFLFDTANFDNIGIGIQFFVLHLILILCISIAGYLYSDDIFSFCKFNASLFLHLVEAIVSSLILYGALSLAIYAMKNLLDLPFSNKAFMHLGIIIAGIFNTIYILGGIKNHFSYTDFKLEDSRFYKILSQYILIPIVALYMVILYAYSVKVLGTKSVEGNDWVSVMVLWFFALGVFTYLLNYIYRKEDVNDISNIYLKWFFYLTAPLILLLFYVSYINIKSDGLMPMTYYNMLLGVWLLATCVYIIMSKIDNIKWIPISLIFVGLFSIFSPWSVCRATVSNQYKKAVEGLTQAGIVSDGVIVNKEGAIDKSTRESLRLLQSFDKMNMINDLDANDLFKEEISPYTFGTNNNDDYENNTKYINNTINNIPIAGYDEMIFYDYYESSEPQEWNDKIINIENNIMTIAEKKEKYEFDFAPFINSYTDGDSTVFEMEDKGMKMKVWVRSMDCRKSNNGFEINQANLILFVINNNIDNQNIKGNE